MHVPDVCYASLSKPQADTFTGTMSCLTENQVTEYLQDTLSRQQRHEVEQHLDRCGACLALVSESVRATTESDAPARLGPGTRVAQFSVIRLLGGGAMGKVYLCRDTRLGRRVALKIIKAEALGSDEAVLRFMREARTTARFAHPHIVTIHDVGRWQERPYLALEYLEGQTLSQRLAEERQSLRAAMRFGLAIAEALAEAHRHQVLHRDLKPSNVMLPRDGRLRVLDFGLAKVITEDERLALDTWKMKPYRPGEDDDEDVDLEGSTRRALVSRAGVVLGTPAYMAPEQWRAEECTEATDTWALGMILQEMLGGHPYEGLDMTGLCERITAPEPVPALAASEPVPERLARVLERCLDKDPCRRPSARHVCGVLDGLLHPGRERPRGEENPFRGLLPFAERHNHLFFGRDDEVAAFVEQLREQAMLPVVGPSGAGKSSFVQAGVIHRLREQASWLVLGMRPGDRPFVTLAERLVRGESTAGSGLPRLSEEDDPAALARELAASPMHLNLELRELARRHRCRVLLVVDQLEELCTGALADDAEQRAAFMRSLCCAGDDPDDPVRVILTLRDDFLGRLATGQGVRRAMGQLTILHSPEAEALRQTITGPLAVVGYGLDDDALAGRMVDEVRGELSALPLLQFAARQMWERRDSERRLLLASAYEEIGGVAGALARHADRVLEGLPEAEVRLARHLLLRLVTPNGTRRARRRSALLEGLPPAAGDVLDRLVRGRLLAVRKGGFGAQEVAAHSTGEDARLELTHESLLSNWDRLAGWIDASKEELAFLSEVGQAAAIWHRRGRRAQEVWRDEALAEALIRAGRVSAASLPEQTAAFLEAGRQRQQQVQRFRTRRLALGVAFLVLVAVGSVIMSLLLAARSREAAAERDAARLQRAAAQREGAAAALAQGEMLQARAKLRSSLQTHDSPLARALWLRLRQSPLVWKKRLGGLVLDTAFSPAGDMVAAGCQDRSIYLIDVRTTKVRILRGHHDQLYTVVFSQDGRTLASGGLGGNVRVWDLSRGTARVLTGHTAAVRHLAFGPRGRLASASWDGTIRLWDLAGGEARVLRGHTGRVRRVTFSPRGERLASVGADRAVRLWDTTTGAVTQVLRGHTDSIHGVSWPRDDRLVTKSRDGTVRLWRPGRTGSRVLARPVKGGIGLSVSPDGARIASAGWGGNVIRLWGVGTSPLGPGALRLTGHRDTVLSLHFGPRGKRLVSGSADRTVRLWRTVATSGIRPAPENRGGHTGMVWGMAVSPGGGLIASGGQDRNILLWDVRTGRVKNTLRGHEGAVTGLAFSPDGRWLASSDMGHAVFLWSTRTWTRHKKLVGHLTNVWGVGFSPDSRWLATSSSDGTIRLWDVATGTERRRLTGHRDSVVGVAFSPDGKTLASCSYDHRVALWSLQAGGEAAPRFLSGHTNSVYGVAFSPDGKTLASGSGDRTVRLWDVATGRGVGLLGPHPGRVHRVSFSPDGKRLGAPCSEGTVRIWDLARKTHVDLRGHRSEVNELRFMGDGRLAASASDDGTVRTWDVAGARPHWRTVALLPGPPRVLTDRGWQALGGAGEVAAGAWEAALQRRALRAEVSPGGTHACVLTSDGHLELWRSGSARAVVRERLTVTPLDMLALSGGCVVLAGERALLLGGGRLRPIPGRFRALAPDRQGFLLASDRDVLLFSPAGKRLARYVGAYGVTAMFRGDDSLILGFKEGGMEVVPLSGPVLALPVRRPRFSFEGRPSSAVTRLRKGPLKTLVAGFANGQWGIWSARSGKQFYLGKLHGAIQHLELAGQTLHVVSAMGQHHSLSLQIFNQDYCQLMRKVWASVPTMWEDGLPRLRKPPKDHRCRQGR